MHPYITTVSNGAPTWRGTVAYPTPARARSLPVPRRRAAEGIQHVEVSRRGVRSVHSARRNSTYGGVFHVSVEAPADLSRAAVCAGRAAGMPVRCNEARGTGAPRMWWESAQRGGGQKLETIDQECGR